MYSPLSSHTKYALRSFSAIRFKLETIELAFSIPELHILKWLKSLKTLRQSQFTRQINNP